MKDTASSAVKVTYYSQCLNESGPLVQTNKCDGLKVSHLDAQPIVGLFLFQDLKGKSKKLIFLKGYKLVFFNMWFVLSGWDGGDIPSRSPGEGLP